MGAARFARVREIPGLFQPGFYGLHRPLGHSARGGDIAQADTGVAGDSPPALGRDF